jgi:hypothetical protein
MIGKPETDFPILEALNNFLEQSDSGLLEVLSGISMK